MGIQTPIIEQGAAGRVLMRPEETLEKKESQLEKVEQMEVERRLHFIA
jgi:hypothetical protein